MRSISNPMRSDPGFGKNLLITHCRAESKSALTRFMSERRQFTQPVLFAVTYRFKNLKKKKWALTLIFVFTLLLITAYIHQKFIAAQQTYWGGDHRSLLVDEVMSYPKKGGSLRYLLSTFFPSTYLHRISLDIYISSQISKGTETAIQCSE